MLQLQIPPTSELPSNGCLADITPSHPSFSFVYDKIKKWLNRFHFYEREAIFNELCLFYRLATKNYLDPRSPQHLFNLILSIYFLHKNLQHSVAFSSQVRHLKIRWMPTSLTFPFSSKAVLGCLVGFNIIDRYELFDEENITLALEKHFPDVKMVKQSFYCHTSRYKDLKVFYFELEKKDQEPFSLSERKDLRAGLEEKIKNSIQQLSPTVFMSLNEEEVYKNILVLSREIESLLDIPQAYITLDQQSSKEISFRIVLVYVAPFHRFSLKDRFFDCTFISERLLTVRHLDKRPIEAQIFRLILPRDLGCVRSDGSLDFYHVREKVVACMQAAIGEFRDYNGGILLKQQELFYEFKSQFPEEAAKDPELLTSFFYTLMPLEKRVLLQLSTISTLFFYFLQNRNKKLAEDLFFSLNVYQKEGHFFLTIHSKQTTLNQVITSALLESMWPHLTMVYHFIDLSEGVFFNCVLLQDEPSAAEPFIQHLQRLLNQWSLEKKNQQTLRIGTEHWPFSLDPRIGGDNASSDVLGLLFEGLTRFDQNGHIENGIAESIEISSDLTGYTFKLRSSFWNDGSPLTAYDFEYAWKKILSPGFKTAFAIFFYLIKNAKKAKEGHLSSDEIGIWAVDDRILKVELAHPAPYFLHLITLPLYFPIHRLIDKHHPEWSYQAGKHYPCNGPFQLKVNQYDRCYHFVKNPFYWDTRKVTLDQLIIKQMNPYQIIQSFRKNELDWIGNPLGSWQSFYTPEKEDQFCSIPNGLASWCIFNTRIFPFNNCKLRVALALVLDREQMISEAPFSIDAAYSLLLPFLNNRHRFFPAFNPEAGRQLFVEALEELNMKKEDFPPLTLTFIAKGILEYVAVFFKTQLKNHLDIECRLEPLIWKPFFSKVTEGEFQMSLFYWTSRINDPIYTLNTFRFAQEKMNLSKWESAEYQNLLELSDSESNPFLRSAYLMEAEEHLSKEMPAIPLFYQPSQMLVKKDVKIAQHSAFGPFNFSQCVKQKE